MYKIRWFVFSLFLQILIICNTNAQTLSSASATGIATTNSSTFSTVTGASVTIDVTSVNYLLVVASFEVQMTSNSAVTRTASLMISSDAIPANNSGVFARGLSAAKITDYGIGSIVHIFDVSAYSGSRTYNLQHAFSTPSLLLGTRGTIVAIALQSGVDDLMNSVKNLASPVTMTDAWSTVTGMETDLITTTLASGFYVAASIESVTTIFSTASEAKWKLQYKKGVGGTWTNLSSEVTRSMSNTADKGIISLVGFLSEETAAGDYYFRIAHIRTSVASTIQTSNANIVALSLEASTGIYPVFSKVASGITVVSTTMSNAATRSITPDLNTGLFIHAQYGISASTAINAPVYDLFVDNAILNGDDQKRYISSASERGAGASVGLAQGLIAGTTYNVSLRHCSDGTNTITTNSILLTGFGLTINSGPLPIELLSFKAEKEEGSVKLTWKTVSESNNDFFTIYRSLNALDWEDIQEIQGAGCSNELLTYNAFDNNPYFGLSYYRLKQTDFDGQYSFSKIASINFYRSINNQIKLFPNPTKKQITIIANEAELEQFFIFNSLGENVTCFTKIVDQDNNRLIIDLAGLSNGAYFLKTKTTTTIMYKN